MITHGNEIKLFAGNSNRPLAEAIAAKLNTALGAIEVGKFSDGETSVHIAETVRGRDLFIIQSTSTPVNDNLMELLIMIDAAKRASAGRITAVMPYFGYARQDRKARSRDPAGRAGACGCRRDQDLCVLYARGALRPRHRTHRQISH